jgi:hypothetical protein
VHGEKPPDDQVPIQDDLPLGGHGRAGDARPDPWGQELQQEQQEEGQVVGRPGICTGPIKFDEITADGINLEWGPPTDDGGAEVSNYIVEKRRTTDSKWATVASATQKNTIRVIRLHDGIEYIFRVFAENKYGVGEYLRSDPVIAMHPFSELLLIQHDLHPMYLH